ARRRWRAGCIATRNRDLRAAAERPAAPRRRRLPRARSGPGTEARRNARNGRRRLVGADFLVLAADWHAKHAAPPELAGQLMHLFESPNRFGLPAFYTLHVWAWKDNPNGMFVNWHPKVSCEAFSGQTP